MRFIYLKCFWYFSYLFIICITLHLIDLIKLEPVEFKFRKLRGILVLSALVIHELRKRIGQIYNLHLYCQWNKDSCSLSDELTI